MDALIQSIRKSRFSWITVCGHKFEVRRPTLLEAADMVGYETTREAVLDAARFVVGWKDVRESDIDPSASDRRLEFNRVLFNEWLEDSADMWSPLFNAIRDTYKKFEERRVRDLKNSSPGLSPANQSEDTPPSESQSKQAQRPQ